MASSEPAMLHAPAVRGKLCEACNVAKAILRRPKNGDRLCKECFFHAFEWEVHCVIVKNALFNRGERVAIGASGGKDSTVLAHVLSLLNKRHDYGLHLILLSIDEGITGYRDDSLESVKRNAVDYGLQLGILSYKDLYGWSMDNIVAEIGLRGNCTFCGVFRRQALDRGARALKVDKVVTGHNADDAAETVLMNLLRGDIARLGRCVNIMTGVSGDMPRCKPFKYCYEKEIVMYAYHKKLDYFSTECIYSPNAYRGFAREFIKDIEVARSSVILDILYSAEAWRVDSAALTATATAAAAVIRPEAGVAAGRSAIAPAAGDAVVGGGSGCMDSSTSSRCSGGACGSTSATTSCRNSHPVGATGTGTESGASGGTAACCGGSGACSASVLPDVIQAAQPRRRLSDAASVTSSSSTFTTRAQKLRTTTRVQSTCVRCGYMTSTPAGLCQACNLLARLEAGQPKLDIGKADGEDFARALPGKALIEHPAGTTFGIKRDASEGGGGVSSATASAALERLAVMASAPVPSAVTS